VELAESVFQWKWLDDVVEASHAKKGSRSSRALRRQYPRLGLIHRYPEICSSDRENRVFSFGSCKRYDHASPIYREHFRRITTGITTRYGTYPAVVGWQANNEWSVHSSTRSYGGESVPPV
jgi:beta-galactosidase